MAIDIDEKLRRFFASAPQTKYVVPMLQFQHSQMSRVWYLWREAKTGILGLEDGSEVSVQAANFGADLAGSPANLDQEFKFTLSLVDIDDLFRDELDRIPIDTKEKIVCVYREYLSDDLSYPSAVARLQVENISYAVGDSGAAATVSAVSPRLNITRTGETYNPRDIPMLRGFL